MGILLGKKKKKKNYRPTYPIFQVAHYANTTIIFLFFFALL